jgi:hypothetical protein
MKTRDVLVKRWSVVSARSFEEVLDRLAAQIGRTDLREFERAMAAAKTLAELEKVVLAAVGPSGFMEVARYDHGVVVRKERGGEGPKMLRLLIGNPLIMKDMARLVPDAASYAPATILVDERGDGVHLSYDSMASLLAPYGDPVALDVAKDDDAKIQKLLETAAR